MVPEWMYDALAAFQSYMERRPLLDVALIPLFSFVASWLLLAVHEAGHALAAAGRGVPVRAVRIGFQPKLLLRLGATRVELGASLLGRGRPGWVRFDPRAARPLDVVVVALAGPMASLVSCLTIAALARFGWGDSLMSLVLVIAGLEAFATTILSAIPRGAPPTHHNDGRLAQIAWRAHRAGVPRARTAPVGPAAGSSQPPPSAALGSDPDP